jgi:hypothetical protein
MTRDPTTGGSRKPDLEDSSSTKTMPPRPAATSIRQIEPSGLWIPALRYVRAGDRQHRHSQRDVDKEYPTPGDVLGQLAPENRTQDQRYAGEAGPGAYRLATPLLLESGAYDSQGVRHEKSGAHTLDRPCRDQLSWA